MIHEAKHHEINHLPEEELTSVEARRHQLSSVLESATFRRSPRLREFLEFIGTRTLEGRADEISEQIIGNLVFHRGAAFSPAEDNIVRATARALRTKLREYFDSEGADDALRIEIPKGSYVPYFVAAKDSVVEPASRRTILGVALPRSRWKWGALLAVALVPVLSIAWLVAENAKLSAVVRSSSPRSSILAALLYPESAVNIIASDALVMELQLRQGDLVSVEDYASKSVFSRVPKGLIVSPDLWEMIRSQPYTQGDDVRAAVRLARSIPHTTDVKLLHARMVGMSTFQSGGDFLILAGRRANPWAGLFEKDLHFQMHFSGSGDNAVFRNRNPRQGERSEYRTRLDDSQTGLAYGRVAVVPGLYGRGKVILVAGTSGETTFAATDFLTEERGLQEVEARIGRRVDPSLARLEVLIETSAIGGGTRDFRILAVRWEDK